MNLANRNLVRLVARRNFGLLAQQQQQQQQQRKNTFQTSRMMSTVLGKDETRKLWKQAKAVAFDVDSTVVTSEGLDDLADFCGAGEAVAELTKKAMGGSMLFHEALQARLELFSPNQTILNEFNEKHPLVLTPGMAELVKTLHERDVHVYLVSGGFRQLINPVADILGIPRTMIFANNFLFNEDGSFAGFDPNEPTSRAGGKAKVMQLLKDTHGYNPIFMIGDGATDMEARPPADAFIGFGGIAEREVVKNGADWFVMDLQELIEPLKEE